MPTPSILRVSTTFTVLGLVLMPAPSAAVVRPARVSLLPIEHYPNSMSVPNHLERQIPACSELIECMEPIFDFGRLQGGKSRRVTATFTLRNRSEKLVFIRPLYGCACLPPRRTWVLLPKQTLHLSISSSIAKGTGKVTIPVTLRESAIRLPPIMGKRVSRAVQWFESQSEAKRRQMLDITTLILSNLM